MCWSGDGGDDGKYNTTQYKTHAGTAQNIHHIDTKTEIHKSCADAYTHLCVHMCVVTLKHKRV